ncbi:MAG: DUF1214 domain-containing protein [Desulfobulbales bacterium]
MCGGQASDRTHHDRKCPGKHGQRADPDSAVAARADGPVFMTNDRKKYSVGENAGMKLEENGGIEVYIAAEKPEGVPEENWLPINRKDEDMDIVLRAYVPDLEKMKTWTPPKAERLK